MGLSRAATSERQVGQAEGMAVLELVWVPFQHGTTSGVKGGKAAARAEKPS